MNVITESAKSTHESAEEAAENHSGDNQKHAWKQRGEQGGSVYVSGRYGQDQRLNSVKGIYE